MNMNRVRISCHGDVNFTDKHEWQRDMTVGLSYSRFIFLNRSSGHGFGRSSKFCAYLALVLVLGSRLPK